MGWGFPRPEWPCDVFGADEDALMMKLDDYNEYCAALPATTHVVQWGDAHVWKVGGKVFAIAGWSDGEDPFITFKCSEVAFEVLREQPGLRPAPYLAARGGKWIQMNGEPGLSQPDLEEHIAESHRLVVGKLTKKLRAELGLDSYLDQASGKSEVKT